MTAPRATTATAATAPAPTPASVPAGPTPPAGAIATPTTGSDGGHFVMTRRRARQLVARAKALGLQVPHELHAKAALIPAEQEGGDTRDVSAPARADVDATREALDASAREIASDAQRDESQQHEQTQGAPHPLAAQHETGDRARAGSRDKPQHASKTGKRAR